MYEAVKVVAIPGQYNEVYVEDKLLLEGDIVEDSENVVTKDESTAVSDTPNQPN